MREQTYYLIIAASARFIAESAREGDCSFITIDGFADQDLRAIAAHSAQVPLKGNALDINQLSLVYEQLRSRYLLAGIIVGPGLEHGYQVLNDLSKQTPLLGNSSLVFQRCGDRQTMSSILDELQIPTVNDCVQISKSPKLSKCSYTGGGGHIQWTEQQEGDQTEIYLPGMAVSHLFLAADGDIASVGFNTQWQSRHDSVRPFCYGGAINRSPLDRSMKDLMGDDARQVSAYLGLKGLNSMDYLLCAGKLYCLELNPRPSASMQINDRVLTYKAGDTEPGLFAAHLRACAGELPLSPDLSDNPPKAHAVIYARQPLQLSDALEWPVGTKDIPNNHSRFVFGQAVCTLTASASDTGKTLTQLQENIRALEQTVYTVKSSI